MGSTSTHIMGRFIYLLAFIGSVASLESNRFFTGIASGLDCCSRTTELCTTPCAGQECTSMCEVRCGFLGSIVCTPLACSAANSAGCISAAPCADGYTQVDSKCMKVVAGPSNYLDALTGSTGAWIGFADFLDEGTFSWVDGTAASFTNWRNNQPNNGNNNQHCTWIRPDGFWD